jgi:hypothetical protein
LPKRNENISSPKDLHKNIYNSFIHDSPKLERHRCPSMCVLSTRWNAQSNGKELTVYTARVGLNLQSMNEEAHRSSLLSLYKFWEKEKILEVL